MAQPAYAPCPRHGNNPGLVRFLLPTADGRWVFFYACKICHQRGMDKSCYIILEVSKEEMQNLFDSATGDILGFYMEHPVNVGGDGDG